jgi:hypothetical protein
MGMALPIDTAVVVVPLAVSTTIAMDPMERALLYAR